MTIACVGDGRVADGLIRILDESGLIDGWMRRHALTAVLVRPDHIVFGSANAPGGESKLLRRLERALQTLDLSEPTLPADTTAGELPGGTIPS